METVYLFPDWAHLAFWVSWIFAALFSVGVMAESKNHQRHGQIIFAGCLFATAFFIMVAMLFGHLAGSPIDQASEWLKHLPSG
jgi:CHASE2 domain-containing sensor protein